MILLTGATGFLGSHVIDELVKRDISFTCFVRKTSDLSKIEKLGIPYTYGNLDDYSSIVEALKGKKGLINIASLGFGHAPNIVKACEETEIKKALFISTTGIFTKLNPDSKAVRIKAEEKINNSKIAHVIIRPTMIYGTSKDRNMWRLIKYLNKVPVLPILGSGKYLQQPVYVKDLAWAIVSAFSSNATVNKSYNISGENALTYDQVVNSTAKALGKRRYKLHVPMKLSYNLLRLYEKITTKPILKAEQVLRLNEHKDFSHKKAEIDFGYSPKSFEEGINLEVKEIKKKEGKND